MLNLQATEIKINSGKQIPGITTFVLNLVDLSITIFTDLQISTTAILDSWQGEKSVRIFLPF